MKYKVDGFLLEVESQKLFPVNYTLIYCAEIYISVQNHLHIQPVQRMLRCRSSSLAACLQVHRGSTSQCGRGLLATKFNKRKKLLTAAFVLLWASWILCSVPYAVFEFVVSFTQLKFHNYKSFFALINHINTVHWDREQFLMYYTWENVAFLIKQSYGVVNSVILLILLKPLHQNLLKCVPAKCSK